MRFKTLPGSLGTTSCGSSPPCLSWSTKYQWRHTTKTEYADAGYPYTHTAYNQLTSLAQKPQPQLDSGIYHLKLMDLAPLTEHGLKDSISKHHHPPHTPTIPKHHITGIRMIEHTQPQPQRNGGRMTHNQHQLQEVQATNALISSQITSTKTPPPPPKKKNNNPL